MFTPVTIRHRHCPEGCLPSLPTHFGVICWNVYKQNRKDARWSAFIRTQFRKRPIDLILLQEAHFTPKNPCTLEGFSFDAAANIVYGDNLYGVMNASRSVASESKAFISDAKEFWFTTRKSLLLTRYRVENGDELLVVNVHAINFREDRAYAKEKERLYRFLEDYEGALLIAGDFNTWSAKRVRILQEMTRRLSLNELLFPPNTVKSFLGHPLDRIFYRKLRPIDRSVLDDGGISDHRPLYARFEIES